MIKAKVNGTQTEIETSWDELSFRKYLKLLNSQSNYTQIIAILLNLPEKDVERANFVGLDSVIQAIKFLQAPPAIDPIPKKLGDYTLPKDITFHSVGQFETLKQEITEATKMDNLHDQTKKLAMYAAIYCQPLNGEEFDKEKAEWLAEKFLDYPCLEVMGAGNFFMARCLSLTSGLPMSYLRKNTLLKTNRFHGLLRRSGFTRFSTMLRVMWEVMTKK